MRPASLLTLLAALAGCSSSGDEDLISIEWSTGDTFHVAARYRVAEAKTEEVAVGLEEDSQPTFGDNWTEEVIWTYQVVESNSIPGSSDELFKYALDHDDADEGDESAKPISVIRAWIDDSLNDDTELLAADPVIYLVLREDRDRLAAVVQFLNIDGERVEKAWHSSELGKSWSALSQSMVTALPTYLAPYGTHFADEDRITENGATVTTRLVDADTVDAYYDDEVGGGLVMNRYVRGQRWPVWTAADNVEARVLSDDDILALRGALPFLLPEPPEDYDYLGALSASIDIDASLKLDQATMAGGFDASAPEGYAPWAGSWWPQSKGALVFGYAERETISGRVRETIDPLKQRMSAIGDELRAMDDAGQENDPRYDDLMLEYRTQLNTLRQTLRSFYNGIRADIDGGKLRVKDGRLEHNDGWGYALDELSPFDKLALQRQVSGLTTDNPWRMQEWELLNHYTPGGGSWWGHCNGWSGAAILTNEPKVPVNATLRGETMEYTTADIKGLLTEAHYTSVSRFYGERYNGQENDIGDLSPKAFQIIVSHYLRDRQVPLVFDTTASEEVWNFPAYAVNLSVRETTPATRPPRSISTPPRFPNSRRYPM